jgi:hypothetical protein
MCFLLRDPFRSAYLKTALLASVPKQLGGWLASLGVEGEQVGLQYTPVSGVDVSDVQADGLSPQSCGPGISQVVALLRVATP